MSDIASAIETLVTANRIVAREGVCDAYGHVSVRHPKHPDRYLLAWSRSPELVEAGDILEFHLDGTPVRPESRPLYAERTIHGALYAARPDVVAVVHNHSYDVVPFSVSDVPLRPLLHVAARIGASIPVWDIRNRFGDATTLLVTTAAQGHDLAATLGDGKCVLMRGHGATVVGYGLEDAVLTAVYLQVNARLQMDALRLGGSVEYLSAGEIAARVGRAGEQVGFSRAWEYLARRAGR